MKAVRIYDSGGRKKLRYEECDRPKALGPDDIIVRLKAAAVTRTDIASPDQSRADLIMARTGGADGAGIVQEAGAGVEAIRPGDPVCLFPFRDCGQCGACLRAHGPHCTRPGLLGIDEDGTYAEYVRVPAHNCFPIPAGFSFEEAAALPLAYLMAWRMLISDAETKPGEWVMIIGAGGGIAMAALQLAVAVGARAIVLSRDPAKLSLARQRGAAGISFNEADAFHAARTLTGKRGVDVIVNCVGGESWSGSLRALARGGRLVTCGALCGSAPETDLRRIFWNHLSILAARSATRQEFARVLRFVAVGQHKPVIDSIFPLREAARAHERLERGEHFGKIVLRIDE